MGNLKYLVQQNSILVSYIGKARRIRIANHHTVEEILQFVSTNLDKVFETKQNLLASFSLYKVGNQLFRLPRYEEKSLVRYFPKVRQLSTEEEKGIKQNFPLEHLKGSYYIEITDYMTIHHLQEGISIYHVLDKAETSLRVPDSNVFLNINIFKNIYFKSLIDTFDMFYNQGKFTLRIYTSEKEIYNFEDKNINELIFKAVKEMMESKLNYKKIGIGRSKEESFKDFLKKQDSRDVPIYCQDSLARCMGLILTKREENEYPAIYT